MRLPVFSISMLMRIRAFAWGQRKAFEAVGSADPFPVWRLTGILLLIAVDFTLGADGPQPPSPSPSPHESPSLLQDGLLAFDMPALPELRDSPKKVFAHYFTQFPLSIDNQPAPLDYYAREYLAADGEGGKHLAYGGYLRHRPLPQLPRNEPDWFALNFDEEVRRAVAIGIDGFSVDILSHEGRHWDRVRGLLDAAQRVDPGFKILLMPDMEAGFKTHPDKLAGAIRQLAGHPSVLVQAEGRLVVSPYNAQRQSAAWWKEWLALMKADGVDISFVPLFQDWQSYAQAFAPISDGFSDWGWRSPKSQAAWRDVPGQAHDFVPLWMAPVAPQDMRPRSLIYWETANSEAFRVMWENAILGAADWVQLITWNDYSEHANIAPSTATQFAYYDLAAYYIAHFKTGRPAAIKRDVLYYFHRIQSTSARPDPVKQPEPFQLAKGSDPPRDEIEMLAFLAAPGTLEIQIGGTIHSLDAPAGMTSFRVPLVEGRPTFRLSRGGRRVISLPSAFAISNKIDYQNLLYHAGGSTRPAVSRE